MNGRNTLEDVLREAKTKAVFLHEKVKEAYTKAGQFENQARAMNERGRDIEIDATHASKRVGELEAELRALPEDDGPWGVPIQAVAPPEARALIEDAKVGPWFICMQLDEKWTFLQIVTLWSDVERFSVSIAENHKGCGSVVALPVRWIKAMPEMLLELYECQKVIAQNADLTQVPGMFELFKHRAHEAHKVIEKTHPPAEGGEG